jgi:hypothetical protein
MTDKPGVIVVNGQEISSYEAQQLIRMLCKDAEKFAGEFHGMDRSEKFRVNWPDEYKFAKANWKTFVQYVLAMYAEMLGNPKVLPEDKRKIHLAIVLYNMISKGQEHDTRLQLFRGTQQFDGDPYENKKIVRQFGTKPNLRAWLRNSTATRH